MIMSMSMGFKRIATHRQKKNRSDFILTNKTPVHFSCSHMPPYFLVQRNPHLPLYP